jgi:hypothetical protein
MQRGQPVIYISTKSSKNLYKYMEPYMIKSMQYKFPK